MVKIHDIALFNMINLQMYNQEIPCRNFVNANMMKKGDFYYVLKEIKNV